MTPEDEEFNRIEREAKQRMEAVRATVLQHEPMHPEIKKMYEDYFDKCFRESSLAERPWVGLTNNELQPIANEYRILFGSWVEDFARAIEAKLREKNT